MLRFYDPLFQEVDLAATFDAAVHSAQLLDVSNWQGRFDWAGTARSYPQLCGGIFRVTQGLGGGVNSPDPEAEWNHNEILRAGLRPGGYHFLDPRLDGAAQARYFVDEYAKIGLTSMTMLWDDNETMGTSPAQTAACARAFRTELDSLRPHNPRGTYTFISFAREGACQGLGDTPLWLAYPNATAPVPPPPWMHWTFWQWGLRNGIDADAFAGPVTALDKWLHSFAPAPPHPVPTPPTFPTGPPFRHLTEGQSIAEIAIARNTTPEHILAYSAAHYTPADTEVLARLRTRNVPWYSANE